MTIRDLRLFSDDFFFFRLTSKYGGGKNTIGFLVEGLDDSLEKYTGFTRG